MTIPVGKGKIEIKIDDEAKKHVKTNLNKLAETVEKVGRELARADARIEKKTGTSGVLKNLGERLIQGYIDKNASSSSKK